MKRALAILCLCVPLAALAIPFTLWFPQDNGTPPPPPPIDAPLAFYRLEEALGAYRLDEVAGLRMFEDLGNVNNQTGKLGAAAAFDTSDFLDSEVAPAMAAPCTLVYWVQFNDLATRQASASGTTGGGGYWTVQHNVFDSGDIYMEVNDNGILFAGAGAISDSAWHFLAIRFASDGQVSLSLDNLAFASGPGGGALGTQNAMWLGTSMGGSYNLNGGVDAVGIFSSIQSDAAITNLFNAGTGREYYSGAWH